MAATLSEPNPTPPPDASPTQSAQSTVQANLNLARPDGTSGQEKPDWLKNYKPLPNRRADRPRPEPKPKAPPKTKTVTVGNRWVKGMKSPNPSGRPPGIRERKQKIHERMLDEAGAVIDVMLQKALEGDSGAAAVVINRVIPVLRPQQEVVEFTLNADAPVSKQVEQVLAAIAQGLVAPDVGKKIVEVVQSLAQTRAVEDLEQRIIALEERRI